MPATQQDVKAIIDNQKMTLIQYTTIFTCFLMNMLDGMDVLVIAFTAPAISTAWGISPEALGVVFSAALVGMTAGALLIAPLADRMGRRAMILCCALLMGISVFATSFVQSVSQLMLLRFISGLGIGGMLASVSTLTSEYAPNKSKDFWVTLVMGGYPVGAVLSGLVAAQLIPEQGWRAMFQFAGIATLVTIPVILLFLGESLEFLVKRKPKNALQKVNALLKKMGVAPFDELPEVEEKVHAGSVSRLFQGALRKQTFILWTAFFMAFAALYFCLSWIPKLTTEAGLSEQLGIYSGTVFNLGSFVGAIAAGSLAVLFGLRKMILVFMAGAAVLMTLFGWVAGSAMVLVMFGFIGFALQGGFTALYPVAARLYPPEIRTTGVGWAIGAGRLGAVLGPILAGFLVGAGFSLTTNFIVFAVPCLLAGIAVVYIKSEDVS